MGYEKVKQILVHIGVDPEGEKMAFFKEGNFKNTKFTTEVYENLVQTLASDKENVEFSVRLKSKINLIQALAPVLIAFFISKQSSAIEKRRQHFEDIMSANDKKPSSLFNCFKKVTKGTPL